MASPTYVLEVVAVRVQDAITHLTLEIRAVDHPDQRIPAEPAFFCLILSARLDELKWTKRYRQLVSQLEGAFRRLPNLTRNAALMKRYWDTGVLDIADELLPRAECQPLAPTSEGYVQAQVVLELRSPSVAGFFAKGECFETYMSPGGSAPKGVAPAPRPFTEPSRPEPSRRTHLLTACDQYLRELDRGLDPPSLEYPEAGFVHDPDIGGPCGFLRGEGSPQAFHKLDKPQVRWLVIEVDASTIETQWGNEFERVYARYGWVVHQGSYQSAAAFLRQLYPDARLLGDRAAPDAKAEIGARVVAGDGGKAVAGAKGHAVAGKDGVAIAGHLGTAEAGAGGFAMAGRKGVASVGVGGQARVGHDGELRFVYAYDQIAVATAGAGAIKADTVYRCNALGELEEVPAWERFYRG